MDVVFLRVGKTDMPFVEQGEKLYLDRLKHYFSAVSVIDTDAGISAKKVQPVQVKLVEEERLLKHIHPGDMVVLLDERGKQYTSVQYAGVLQKWLNRSPKRLVFVTGGAFGFGDQMYARADAKLSLSPMTFSHQLIRVIFLEQLYRASTILKGEKYHNE
jgi:23S rRNA (pseudouridine1915-N3)-methyltransferase